MSEPTDKRSPCADYALAPAFDDGRITLHQFDMRRLDGSALTADLVVTDPPYGETSLAWDQWVPDWPARLPDSVRSMWCFGSMRMFLEHGHEFTDAGWKMSQDIVWEKHNGSGFAADRFKRVHEHAVHWYRGSWDDLYKNPLRERHSGPFKGRVRAYRDTGDHLGNNGQHVWEDDGTRMVRSVLYAPSMHQHAVHPTQKPTAILEPLIEYGCPPDGLVLDPFAGSGSTLVAARHLGCRAVGIEARADYIEAAVMRLSQGALDLAGVAQSDGYPATD